MSDIPKLDRPPGVFTDDDWRLIEIFSRRQLVRKLSDAEAAADIGYRSASAWSTLRAGKYGADPRTILKRIGQMLEQEAAEARSIKPIPYADLQVADEIREYLDDRRDRHCMGFVCGAPGIGKTAAICHYAATHDNVIIITCKDGMTPYYLLRLVADALGATFPKNTSRVEAIGHVAAALAGVPRSLLIIDEADKLGAAQEAARDLWLPEGHCGHVWAGTAAFWARLNRSFGSTAGQIARRFGDILSINRIGDEDVSRVLAHYPAWQKPVLARARELGLGNTGRLCEGLAFAQRLAAKAGAAAPSPLQLEAAFAALASPNH